MVPVTGWQARQPRKNHFVDINKLVSIWSGAERPVDDIALTRYACYLIAQNGDPAKSEIAFAQIILRQSRTTSLSENFDFEEFFQKKF